MSGLLKRVTHPASWHRLVAASDRLRRCSLPTTRWLEPHGLACGFAGGNISVLFCLLMSGLLKRVTHPASWHRLVAASDRFRRCSLPTTRWLEPHGLAFRFSGGNISALFWLLMSGLLTRVTHPAGWRPLLAASDRFRRRRPDVVWFRHKSPLQDRMRADLHIHSGRCPVEDYNLYS